MRDATVCSLLGLFGACAASSRDPGAATRAGDVVADAGIADGAVPPAPDAAAPSVADARTAAEAQRDVGGDARAAATASGANPIQGVAEVKGYPGVPRFAYTIGIAWSPKDGRVVFSGATTAARAAGAILRFGLDTPGDLAPVRAGASPGTNLIDAAGNLLTAEGDRILRTLATGAVEVVASVPHAGRGGIKDLAARSDGTLFATVVTTDPGVGTADDLFFADPNTDAQVQVKPVAAGAIYATGPGGAARDVTAGLKQRPMHPNGVTLSPDEKTLYVTDTLQYRGDEMESYRAFRDRAIKAGEKVSFKPPERDVWALPVAADGTLGEGHVLAHLIAPEGLCVDDDGNVWVAASDVEVVRPDGKRWGMIISRGADATDITFGGPDRRTILETARPEGSPDAVVYRTTAVIPGRP